MKMPMAISATTFVGLVFGAVAQPVIIKQPQNQTNRLGETAMFSVEATGTPPLSYRWRDHPNTTTFTQIAGATNATLTLTNLKPTSHRFAVAVSNSEGSTMSTLARLIVNVPPPITNPHFSGNLVALDKTIALSLNGSVTNLFSLTGTVRNQFLQMFELYGVDTSTNPADWTRLAVLLRTNNDVNPLLFKDTNAGSFNHRFYRTFTNNLVTGFPKGPIFPNLSS